MLGIAAALLVLPLHGAAPSAEVASAKAGDVMPAFREGDRILFQGDSITDGNRGRNADPNHILGHGYVFVVSAQYGAMLPERHLTFMNRGISGNKVSDLAQRWQADTIALKPNLLSIMIGVNDLNAAPPVRPEIFEQQYDQLLADTVKALPEVRLVLCEPFGLPVGKKKDGWEAYRAELEKRQAVVAKLGDKYKCPVVHLQKVFDDACKRAPADYWIWDGIHPTYSGHQLVADEWVKVVKEFWRGK
jgi:lysophospholipase L1-like esterase